MWWRSTRSTHSRNHSFVFSPLSPSHNGTWYFSRRARYFAISSSVFAFQYLWKLITRLGSHGPGNPP